MEVLFQLSYSPSELILGREVYRGALTVLRTPEPQMNR